MKIVQGAPLFDPAAIGDPQTRDVVAPESAGSAVVRAQILLDRAHFSQGEIDGYYGRNLRTAILGYQRLHGIPPTGVIDPDTWTSLNADAAPVLVPYMTTPEDEKGPFQPIPNGMEEQAKLDYLGYQFPAEELGERFHIAPELLAALNPDADLTQPGEMLVVPNVARPYGTVAAAQIVVSRNAQTVTAFDAGGDLLAQYPATIGSEHDPLPIGNWLITSVQQNPRFHYNPVLFWDADPKDTRALLPPGPNNPVGVVWIGLSKEHYGIHGTPDPGKIGHAESHGCIRLTNWDAEELSQMVKKGVPAILTE